MALRSATSNNPPTKVAVLDGARLRYVRGHAAEDGLRGRHLSTSAETDNQRVVEGARPHRRGQSRQPVAVWSRGPCVSNGPCVRCARVNNCPVATTATLPSARPMGAFKLVKRETGSQMP
eukprot:scaffold647_cov411-Prasinococcus_capsulatus_cf.AAC.16